MLYKLTIYPVEVIYKALYLFISGFIGSYGISLILLSITTTILILPFMHWANRMQANEKHVQDVMAPQIEIIKSESTGAQRHERITKLYRRYAYHPVMAVRSAAGVALQIPFLMAAYYMLSSLPNIQGQSFLVIKDLSKPDGLLLGINLLPILMTVINLISAWTTVNFKKKDKIQAAVIAFLFLLLLYTAPSALLVFWTCNNLWVLLGNVWKIAMDMTDYVPRKVTVKGKTIIEWASAMQYYVYAVMAFTTSFFVFIPIDIYIRNSHEFWFALSDILWILLFCWLVSSLLALVVIYLLKDKRRLLFVSLLLGVGFGLCLQSYIINADYGVLDGRQIDWASYRNMGIANTFLWFICLISPFVCYKFSKNIAVYKKTVKRLCCGLIIMQLFAAIYFISITPLSKKTNAYFSTDKMFSLSSTNNLVVFILDTFESKEFNRIINEHAELARPLEGFIYYPDVVGSYPTTIAALPQILTGKWYEHKESYDVYLRKGWQDNAFWHYLHSKGYDCRVYPDIDCVAETTEIDNLVRGKVKISSHFGLTREFFKLTAFRSLPHYLKRYFVLYTGDFDAYRMNKIYHADDVEFYRQLCADGFNMQDDTNCFRFYHLQGPHGPWTMTREIKRDYSGTLTHDDQAIASLKIVNAYITKLKSLGIYDKTAIVIMADHGNHSGEAVARNPLVLVKEQGATGALKISDNPISYANLFATFVACIDDKSNAAHLFGIPFMQRDTGPHQRRFLSYIWKIPAKREDVVPPLEEYYVSGDARDENSWHRTSRTYGIEQGTQNGVYELGDKITFSKNGDGKKLILDPTLGWSSAENDYTWTDSKTAEFQLVIEKAHNQELNMVFKLFPYLANNLHKQTVDVFINGKMLAKWNITKEDSYCVALSKKETQSDRLNVKFIISDPMSPKDAGQSEDTRKLGIAIKELVVSKKDNK